MLLHLQPAKLEEAIRATARHMSLPVSYVEKDYWITMALKVLANSAISDDIVFKGGTSLSKAYGLISRFSEDIDIAVLTQGLSTNQAKNRVKKATKIVADIYDEIESEDTSRNSHFRKIRFAYPRIDNEIIQGQVTDSLLLEVNAFADPEPYLKMAITSYVADFFVSIEQHQLINQYDLAPFEMNVLSMTRTVCEKIMGLVKASSGDGYLDNLKQKIRHLYDVYFLMSDQTIRQFVLSDGFELMIHKVITCDGAVHPEAAWLNEPLSKARIFSNFENIWPVLESTYNSEFRAMVVDNNMPSKAQFLEVITIIYQQLLSLDSK